MTDYTKLVKELRGCKDIDYCTDCPRMTNGYVEFCNIKDDAAAAIEELQAEVESMDESCKKQLVAMASHVADLQAEVERLKADVDAAYAH